MTACVSVLITAKATRALMQNRQFILNGLMKQTLGRLKGSSNTSYGFYNPITVRIRVGEWFITRLAVRILDNLTFIHSYFNHFCSTNVSIDFGDCKNHFKVSICNFFPRMWDSI